LDGHLRHEQLLAGGAALRSLVLERLEHVHAAHDLAEQRVLAIEPRRGHERQEELATVGAGHAGVGHGQHAGPTVPHRRAELAIEAISRAARDMASMASSALRCGTVGPACCPWPTPACPAPTVASSS